MRSRTRWSVAFPTKEDLMNKKLLLSASVLALLVVGTLLVRAKPTAADSDDRTSFTFMVILNRSVANVDQIIFNGHGSFGASGVRAGGVFTRFTPCTTPPCPIVASGRWSITKVISFTPAGTFGLDEAGVLVADVTLVGRDGSEASGTVTVVCNIAAGNLSTGQPGGVTLTVPNGTFVATASLGDGFTIFTTGVEEEDEDLITP